MLSKYNAIFGNNLVTKHEYGSFMIGLPVIYIEFSTDEGVSACYHNLYKTLIYIIDKLL